MMAPAVTPSRSPIHVAMLFDGNEQYGLPHAVAGMLRGADPASVRTTGVFLGRGDGYDTLAPLFEKSICLNTGPIFPLRRPGGPRIDPIYLIGRAFRYVRSVNALRRWLRETKSDLIHTHTYRLAQVAGSANRGLKTRHVWHLHGAYPFGNSSSGRFERRAALQIDAIACISRYVADTLPATLRSFSQIVPNGIDIAALRASSAPRGAFRQRFNIPEDAPLVGVFGAVVPIKGHRYFVEAAAQVLKSHPEARFAIVGGTTDSYEKMGALRELTAQIESLGITDRVIQTGFVADAPTFMADFDLIALPSIVLPGNVGEGFGMVLIEAMSQGVPVIATTGAGPAEIIEDGVSGLLVPPADAASLGKAVARLLADDGERRAMGIEAASRAQQFDAVHAAAALLDVYRSALTSHPVDSQHLSA